MGEEREYVCVWKIRIDRTDIHFFHQAHSSLLPRYKWFCCAAVRLRSICTISLKIKRLTVQFSLADYTMPMRIKQTCLFSSNNSLRGYVRVRMIMLIAWLPKSKSTTPYVHMPACGAVNKSRGGSPLCYQRGLLYLGSAATGQNNNPVTCHWGSAGKQPGFPLSQAWSTGWHSHRANNFKRSMCLLMVLIEIKCSSSRLY